MNCIIIEDDELSILALQKCITREANLNLKEIFRSAEDALAYLKNNSCDLIFLDIEMKEMSGIEFIKKLGTSPNIIIISSKADYAAEAFDFDVVDYIVKPLNYERFLKSINKVNAMNESIQTANKKFFYLKQQSKMVQVFFDEILYVEALADYVNIHTSQKRYTILSTMKALENQFPKNDFMRVHRSYIVRLDKIREIEENTVSIEGNLIPISRANKEDFQRKINML